jgi:hypothetical protein
MLSKTYAPADFSYFSHLEYFQVDKVEVHSVVNQDHVKCTQAKPRGCLGLSGVLCVRD